MQDAPGKKPSKRSPPTARAVATEVLVRVDRDDAFASAALESALGRAVQLDARDRALATELAYGSLRVRGWLEERIVQHASRPLGEIDRDVRAELVVAAYQLFFLTRVPPFAAVNEAVSRVRAVKGERVAAFANAVLRRLSEEASDASRSRVDATEAALRSAPSWLRDALVESVGEGHGRALLAGGSPPPVSIRVHSAQNRDAWVERLNAAAPDATVEAGRVSPHAVLLRGAGRTRDLPGYGKDWAIQEEGSQVVALALGARAGDDVLDACAGRGNKTALLASQVSPGGAVDAADLYAEKLERLGEQLSAMGVPLRATFAVDWSIGPGELAEHTYDRVLVDAPCSGSGTLRRRPDLAARRSPARLGEIAALELAIVKNAARLLRPGGRLVYAVCSVLRDEAEAVVKALLHEDRDLEPAPFDSPLLVALAGDATNVRLLPDVHGTDGYFLASFRKVPIASPGGAA